LSGRNRLSLDDASLLFHLDELVRTKPAGNELVGNPTDEHQEWVGRARALISAWDAARGVNFNSDCDKALAADHYKPMEPIHAFARVISTIQEARSELRMITGGQVSASFAAGQPFDIAFLHPTNRTAQARAALQHQGVLSEIIAQLRDYWVPHFWYCTKSQCGATVRNICAITAQIRVVAAWHLRERYEHRSISGRTRSH
jgi:hypothetical protein